MTDPIYLAPRSNCGRWLVGDDHRYLHNFGATLDLWRVSLLP